MNIIIVGIFEIKQKKKKKNHNNNVILRKAERSEGEMGERERV